MTSFGLCSAALTLAACAPRAVSLGGGELHPEDYGDCARGVDRVVVSEDNLEVSTQTEIDELAGCVEITSSLMITASRDLDLSPLGALRVVRNWLRIEGAGRGDGLADLTGLEGLERVGSLFLIDLDITTLEPLASLEQVAPGPLGEQPAGTVGIYGCPGLTDLTGLEQLLRWDDFILSDVQGLQSLNGLSMSGIHQSLLIGDAPKLRDLAGIRATSLLGMRRLALGGTGIERLGFEWVLGLEELMLDGNPLLVEVDLRAVRSLAWLEISNNERLETLVDAPYLGGLERIWISKNPSLSALPALGAPLDGGFTLNDDETDIIYPEFEWIEISDNAQLADAALPRAFSFGSHVRVLNNPRLTTLDLNPLESANHLVIRDNPLLSAVQMPLLGGVDEIEIVNNSSLGTSGFANLKTYSSEMSGNLDTPAPGAN